MPSQLTSRMLEKFGFGTKDPSPAASRQHTFPPVPPRRLVVETAPAANLVLENVLAVPPNTFHDGQYVLCEGRYVFSVRVVPNLAPSSIGVGGAQREWTQWAFRKEVLVEPFDIFANSNSQVYLAQLEVDIDFYTRAKTSQIVYEQEQLGKQLMAVHRDHIFSPGQIFAMEQGGVNFKVVVRSTAVVDLGNSDADAPASNKRGILIPQTEIVFHKAPNSPMQLKGAARARTNLLQPNFKFEAMGIGGLDEEFSVIFRRAFASRICPPKDIERLGIQHVKGVLLFGPPGTGKTLIARQIGKMLNTVEPKVVNGPEMLSKFVGGSEENIRKLFKDAEDEYKSKGEDSNLHIIIFDELDAVFKQRGSRNDGTGVGDNVVNQLLAKMDGVDQLNNILVIGMTNRKDLIDSALMRPGRFELQLEIPLPTEGGRKQILTIHTTKMKSERILGADVDLDELAARTKNFSGAELEGLVKSAASFALKRNFSTNSKGSITFDAKKELKVVRDDFLQALEGLKPAFGVNEEELSNCIHGGIINYSPYISDLLAKGNQLVQQVRHSAQFPLVSVLVHGPPGAGKSALAASIALASDFPFIKMISPFEMVGMTEAQKVNHIQMVFQDSYKSPLNVVVIDQLEQIIDWVDVGPRFSNAVLQAIMVFVRRYPPAGRRLIVLATTSSYEVIQQLGLTKDFNQELYVTNISSLAEIRAVLDEENFLEPLARDEIIASIQERTQSDSLMIGVKKLLFLLESAKVSEHPKPAFIEAILESLRPRIGDFKF